MNVVPLPNSLYTPMCPPDCLTIVWHVAKPRPVPLPFGLVVKNASNRCALTSSLMPTPVSLTASITYSPGATPACIRV